MYYISVLQIQTQIKYHLQTHEIAVDIKRVWKAMKEAQEQGQLLNSRQKLFLVPITPYDTLNKLIKEFEPYRNLWITASGNNMYMI